MVGMSHKKISVQSLCLAFAGSIILHMAILWFPAFSHAISIYANSSGHILNAEIKHLHAVSPGATPSTNATRIGFTHISIPHTHAPLSHEPRLIESSVDPLIFDNANGILELQLNIDRFGRASSVKVLKSTLPREVEGQVVLRFFKAKYQPGELNGNHIASPIRLHIELF